MLQHIISSSEKANELCSVLCLAELVDKPSNGVLQLLKLFDLFLGVYVEIDECRARFYVYANLL